ncbi:hypothetical protein [Streptomyces sp. A1136]|uniref:hypothetical protein n=1 Tax=Streptomyces sp. A1136 TaxID=2563102 RepID=UPI0014486253|nr:hypothetical protein [Streptomyces sp. A1136]
MELCTIGTPLIRRIPGTRLGATEQVNCTPCRATVRPQQGSEAFGVALPVAEGFGDVEVRGVRGNRLHARGDVLGEGEELLVQVGVGVVREVEVGVEDSGLLHVAHRGLPGLV